MNLILGCVTTYADIINSIVQRIQYHLDENILRQKIEAALDQKNHPLVKVFNRRAITVDEVVEDLLTYADRIKPLVADTSLLINKALDNNETVLFEGGQATMLDLDQGTYPFVSSFYDIS